MVNCITLAISFQASFLALRCRKPRFSGFHKTFCALYALISFTVCSSSHTICGFGCDCVLFIMTVTKLKKKLSFVIVGAKICRLKQQSGATAITTATAATLTLTTQLKWRMLTEKATHKLNRVVYGRRNLLKRLRESCLSSSAAFVRKLNNKETTLNARHERSGSRK